MSVLSWRLRSSAATSSCREFGGPGFSFIFKFIAFLGVLIAAGCADNSKYNLTFDVGKRSDQEWSIIDKTCHYEAVKAVAAVTVDSQSTYDRIYVACVEAKGIPYVGKTRKGVLIRDAPI
ncbi:hypothetical protein [Microvirga pudoricolor]|uniref:hypothetical protein n=1 Tax=Microvirga pudoricolor TaxID=2778729 RepID=UPI00194F1A01|nr:hypothetical protein [Microvirga pudoricolor]MBM6592373.1 hypothetical protein [Microvirga pudoricolor]